MQRLKLDGFPDSRQSKMRRVVALFDGHAKPGDSLFGGLGQSKQRLPALDAGPENARTARVWEPAEPLDFDIDSALDRQSGQDALQLVQSRCRPFSDELRGDVEVVGRAPADLRGRTQAAHEATQCVLYLGGNIDRGKQTHAKLTSVICATPL